MRTRLKFSQWGAAGQGSVDGAVVPDGERWTVYAAGVATDDGALLDWRLQIKTIANNGECCWLVPIECATAASTPVLALSREVPLLPGDRLSARVSGLSADKKLCLLYLAWREVVGT